MRNATRTSYTLLPFMLVLLLLGFTGGSSKDDDDGNGGGGDPGANEVWMQGGAFTPSNRTVSIGTSVFCTNKDGTPHTVTSDGGVFASGNLGNNASFSFIFSTAGSFPYHCAIHPGMTGTITVQ